MVAFMKALIQGYRKGNIELIEFKMPGVNGVDFAVWLHTYCGRNNLRFNNVGFNGDTVTVVGLHKLQHN